MHNSLGMGGRERVGHLHGDVQNVFQRHRLAMDALLQALALQLFHDDEGLPVVVFNVVDGADVGVVQLRSSPGLPRESLQRARVLRQVLGDEFQGDMTPQTEVFRFVNNSHSTDAQLRQHAVMRHRLANDFHGFRVERTLPSTSLRAGLSAAFAFGSWGWASKDGPYP